MAFPAINVEEAVLVGEALEEDVTRLVKLFQQRQDTLVALTRDPELLAAVGAGAAGLSLAEERSRALLRRVDAELQSLIFETRRWTAQAVQTHVGNGVEHALTAAADQGFVGVATNLGVPNTQAIRIIAEEILDDAQFMATSTRRSISRHFRATQQVAVTEAAINESLLISETRLENADARRKRLRVLFAKNVGAGKFINVNGRFFKLNTYADIIARTRLTEAAIEGALQATLSMGIDLVRVSDHGKTDKFCDPYAGKVFSISGNTKGYPTLVQRPPFHPRCRHTLTPFVTELKSPDELRFVKARNADIIPPGTNFEDFIRAAS